MALDDNKPEQKDMPIVEEVKVDVAPEKTPLDTFEVKRAQTISTINKIGAYLKIPLLQIMNTTAFFFLLFVIALTLNAIYSNIHFDLSSIKEFYLVIVGKQTVEHGLNSVYNSDRGKMPTAPAVTKTPESTEK